MHIDTQQLLETKDRRIASLEAQLELTHVLIKTLDRQLQKAIGLCAGPQRIADFQGQVAEIVADAENRA
jgi:hypothetical protein